MIRHIVAFNFGHGIPAEAQAAILAELDTFPQLFPAMRQWSRGHNISRRDQTYQHAFVVDFDSEADLTAYLSSERHERFVAERWRPNVPDRAITSFEYDPAG